MSSKVIILDKLQIGEDLLKLSCIQEEGFCTVFLKKGLKRALGFDLFDSVEISTSVNKQNAPFIREVQLLKSRRSISADYEAFQAACDIASFINKNASWMDENGERYQLVGNSLDALLGGKHCAIIYLKFLFKLSDMEGYPVRQEWFNSLSNKSLAKSILVNPTPIHCEVGDLLDELRYSLNYWLKSSTDFYGLD